MADDIAYIRVHPGIGIARLGNSGDGDTPVTPLAEGENFFVGPEAPGIVVDPGGSGGPGPEGGSYRDAKMGLKRQAQRFRIYAYDKDDNAVAELTSATSGVSSISWRVHARNVKAANYAFQGAYLFDNTLFRNPNLDGPGLNETMSPDDRTDLIIDPGVQVISTASPAEIALKGNCFSNTTSQLPKYLEFVPPFEAEGDWVTVNYVQATGIEIGRLQLDAEGRLLFIAGPGKSDCVTTPRINLSNPSERFDPPNGPSVTGAPDGNDRAYQPLIDQFAYFNVPGWWDDTCGGEIDVTVEMEDGTLLSTRSGVTAPGDEGTRDASRGGWVVTAPPKYAPDMYHVVTIKDRVFEAFQDFDPTLKGPTEFWRDIYPILSRAVNYGWVSAEAGGVTPENRNLAHGPKQAGNLLSQANLDKFKDPSDASKAVRTQIYKIMRKADPGDTGNEFPTLRDTLPPPPPESAQPPAKASRSARGNKMPKLWGTAGKPLQNQQLGNDFPNQYLSLTANDLMHMSDWAAGNFEVASTPDGGPPPPVPLADIPVADQPLAMDCAAVEPTIGGGFHPGIEFPYLICYREKFEGPFRVKADITPGSVAAFMSSPWQGDYWSCNTAWWPVQRPDIVFKYHGSESPRTYCEWFRGFDQDGNPLSSTDGYNQMVYAWPKLGMVLPLRDETGAVVTENGSIVFEEFERDPSLNTNPVTGQTVVCDDDMH